jgi:hypothetical protein
VKKINSLVAAAVLVASLAGTAQAVPAQEAAGTGLITSEYSGFSISLKTRPIYPNKFELRTYKDISGFPPELSQWRYDASRQQIVNDATNYVIAMIGDPSYASLAIASAPRADFTPGATRWKWDATQHTLTNIINGHLLCSTLVSTTDTDSGLKARKTTSVPRECKWTPDIFN